MSQNLAGLLAAGAVFLFLMSLTLAFGLPARPRSPFDVRMARIAARGRPETPEATAGGDARARKRNVEATLRSLEVREKERRTRKVSLRTQLDQAGLDWTERTFTTVSIISGVMGFLAALMMGMPLIIALGCAFSAGFGLPRFWLKRLRATREARFVNQFAEALDVMARGLRAGLPLSEGVRMIAEESPDPVGKEFRTVMDAQGVGLPMEQALQRLHERMPIAEVGFFTIALQIQRQTGGNLSETLANLSAVLRGRKQLKGKVGALSAEGRVSAMIIGSLPFVVLGGMTAMSPDYVTPLFSTPLGYVLMGVGGFWMFLGTFVMWRMIAIKV